MEIPYKHLEIALSRKNPRTFERGDIVEIAENCRYGPAIGLVLEIFETAYYPRILVGMNKKYIHWVYMRRLDKNGNPVYDNLIYSMDNLGDQ